MSEHSAFNRILTIKNNKIVSNKKIRAVLALCVVLWTFTAAQLVVTYAMTSEKEITEAFATSDNVQISGCTIDIIADLGADRDLFDIESKGSILSVVSAVGDNNMQEDDIAESANVYSCQYSADKYDINCAAVWSEELQHTYLHCVVTMKNEISECGKIRQTVQEAIDECGHEYIAYTRVDAFISGRRDDSWNKAYADKIFGRLDAKPIQINNVLNPGMTEYGYSDRISGGVMSGDEKINVQIAFSYNEEKDITEICVGTPIINTAY